MATLHLTLTDYLDPTRWRWVLSDERGAFLADHDVRLDRTSRKYQGFCDLRPYLDYYAPIQTVEAQLATLGAWVGEQVFGGLRAKLRERCNLPATPVQVTLPARAGDLLLRPFELACFADGTRFDRAGVRFIYHLEGTPAHTCPPVTDAVRVLAAFSLPVRANPLNLRRERYGLQCLARDLRQQRSRAVELRVLHYGATRETLRAALEEDPGWDVIHLSGHGAEGVLLLEDESGGNDPIDAADLGELLELTAARLKLLILDACYSASGSHAAARRALGLDPTPVRQEGAEGAEVEATAATALPGLAQTLAARLGCAALAMRYPVDDAFATDLMLALYEKLLDKGRPLPAALHLALDDALRAARPPLSPFTPLLVGAPAAALALTPPPLPPQGFDLPQTGLGIAFPPEPARFVGRLQPLLRASQALAPRSAMRGVLFYGMPGAGKTTCALELAYRHAEGRFQGYVWYKAPEEGSDIANALFNLLQDVQTQLNAPTLGLTTALDDPARFRQYTLPRLRDLLQRYSLLLVLDNLETLLTASGDWRDPLWGDLVDALLAHNGPSRVVLTSRRRPARLEGHPRLHVEAIHALSLAESALLARELPRLRRLFDDAEGLALLRATLRVVQGHPKLLELADGAAGDGGADDRAALQARVDAAQAEADTGLLDAFFAPGGADDARAGETRQDEADFTRVLRGWTRDLAAGLAPAAGRLLAFLSRLEPEDRQGQIVEANWQDFLTRLGEPDAPYAPAMDALEAAGLVGVERAAPAQFDDGLLAQLTEQAEQAGLPPAALQGLLAQLSAGTATYTLHPGVAEAVRAAADPAVLDAADVELGNFHIAMYQQALKREMQGMSSAIAASARRAAPYLLRQERWEAASTLLERMLQRDSSPDTLAFTLPLLRRVVEATAGTTEGLENAGVLANALRLAGRVDEAEGLLRDLIEASIAQNNYRSASVKAGVLLDLLRNSGRLEEALAVAEEMAGYTRRAGLGPWTQLADETYRLQVLAAMGKYDAVLDAVEALRPRMAALPLESATEETANPWNVRETLLDTGRSAAMRSERWERALALNAEIVKYKQERGANTLELARRRFNDYGPLLRLERFDAARDLLLDCRAVFEAERDIYGLQAVYSALADLEDKAGQGAGGNRAAAIRFEQTALGYTYQAGEPEDCAISHNNLANYLERSDTDPALVLAHRLAAAVIRLQTQSGRLPATLRTLANSALPPTPPSFAGVVARVEAIEGVRFAALFERLPRRVPDGDAAIAAVWQLVGEEKQRRGAEAQRKASVLASMPPAIQAAFELDGAEFSAALRAALEALSEDEAQAVLQQLREAGLIGGGSSGPDMAKVLREFEPLLQGIAAAVGDESVRAKIEPVLPRLEEQGWRLSDAARRIWAGERDAAALTAGIDGNSAQLVRRVLELLAGHE